MNFEERFAKARRNLVTGAGLLVVSTFVGVEPANKDGISVLPFTLSDPGHLKHVFAVLVAFLVYNVLIAWKLLVEEGPPTRIRRVDLVVVTGIALAALCSYLVQVAGLLDAIATKFSLDANEVLLATVVLLSLGIAFAARGLAARSTAKGLENALARNVRESQLKDMLLSSTWLLHFNPKSDAAVKQITFLADGKVGRGANENEYEWAMVDEKLRVFRVDGDLQNEFYFQGLEGSERGTGGFWRSLNPDNSAAVKRGIRNQFIEWMPTPVDGGTF